MTTDEVRVELNPLADRICDLEPKDSSLESKSAITAKKADMLTSGGESALIETQAAKKTAREASTLPKACCDRVGVAADAAAAASNRAEAAAAKADPFGTEK